MASDDIKAQRRLAYDALSAPLERLSVKQLMEFKSQERVKKDYLSVNSTVEQLTDGVVQLIAEVDSSMEIQTGVTGWSSSQKGMSKPGHFINALRRFPYAVDSGRISDAAASGVTNYINSGQVPSEDSHLVAHLLHEWTQAAYQYYGLKKQSSVATRNSSGVQKTSPKSTTPTMSSMGKWAKASNTSTSNDVLTKNSYRKPPGGPGSLKPSPKSSSTSPGINSTSNALNIRPASAGTSAVSQGRKPGGVRPNSGGPIRGPSSAPGSGPQKTTVDLTSEARRLALGGLPDWAIEIEQMKREVRELKSQESRTKWDLKRQERAAAQIAKRQNENELAEWRAQQLRDEKEIQLMKEQELKQKDLAESKEFIAFKKERKKLEKVEYQKHIEEEYLTGKDHAEWLNSLSKQEKEDYHRRAKDMETKRFEERAIKMQQKVDQKAHEEAARTFDRQLEIEKMRKDLMREREELLARVNFAKDSMNKNVRESVGMEFWKTK